MNKLDKKGFTLVELIAVVVILIVLMTVAVAMANKQMEKSRVNAFLKEANTFAKGALQKESVDRTEDLSIDDIFHNVYPGKVCYSVTQNILDKYVSKPNNKYYGSVEVCYGLDCTYQTKLWISDGKHFIDGVSDPKSEADISTSFTSTQYPESCGVKAIGGGTKGDLTTAEFDYTGGEQVMEINIPGVYAFEVWGAQGGDYSTTKSGAYGSYTYGEFRLKKGDKLYINIGQKGSGPCEVNDETCKASYNGGSKGAKYMSAGGGATHIGTKSGQLFDLSDENILLVAGGGGGRHIGSWDEYMMYPGGYCDSMWPNARECGKFGYRGGFKQTTEGYYGNGGGYSTYIGRSCGFNDENNYIVGGTGFISGKSKNGQMYCYACPSSTNTTVFADYDEEPLPKYSKVGNGYAKITYIENFTESE